LCPPDHLWSIPHQSDCTKNAPRHTETFDNKTPEPKSDWKSDRSETMCFKIQLENNRSSYTSCQPSTEPNCCASQSVRDWLDTQTQTEGPIRLQFFFIASYHSTTTGSFNNSHNTSWSLHSFVVIQYHWKVLYLRSNPIRLKVSIALC
jgi:hypothetical protein